MTTNTAADLRSINTTDEIIRRGREDARRRNAKLKAERARAAFEANLFKAR
jgi:hypothetical protein